MTQAILGDKIRSGDTTPTLLGAHKWAKWLHNHSCPGVPKQCRLGADMWAKLLRNPCCLGGQCVFNDDLVKHIKKTPFEDFTQNTNSGTKSSDTKSDVIYKRACCGYL